MAIEDFSGPKKSLENQPKINRPKGKENFEQSGERNRKFTDEELAEIGCGDKVPVDEPKINLPQDRENISQDGKGNRKFTNKELKEIGQKKGMSRRRFLGILGGGAVALGGGTAIEKGIKHLTKSEELKPKSDIASTYKTKESLKKITWEREHMPPEEILQEFVKTFEKEKRFTQQIPRDIFSDDFFIAQQFSESRYNKDAESDMEARGIFQNRVESIVEVINYLSKLRDKDKLANYSGPIDINKETAEKMHQLLDKDDDYGRATGKLYDICMWDPDYNYNPGNKYYKNKSTADTQRYIYAQYIEGPKARLKKPSEWLKSTKPYVKKNMELQEDIQKIREKFTEAGHDPKADFDVVEVLKETDRKENRNKDIVEVTINYLKNKKSNI